MSKPTPRPRDSKGRFTSSSPTTVRGQRVRVSASQVMRGEHAHGRPMTYWTPSPFSLGTNLTFGSHGTLLNADVAWREDRHLQRQMRRDPDLIPAIETRTMMVSGLDWSIEANSDDGKKEAADVEAMMREWRSLPHFLSHLAEAWWYGHQGCAIRYEVDATGLFPAGFTPIDPDAIGYDMLGRELVRTSAASKQEDFPGADRVLTPDGVAWRLSPELRRSFVCHRWAIDPIEYHGDDNTQERVFRGEGFRSKLYLAWVEKQHNQRFMRYYGERFAYGKVVWRYPMGNAQAQANAEQGIDYLNTTTGVAVPVADMKDPSPVEFLEASGTGYQVLQDLHMEDAKRMRKAILFQDLSTDAGATGLGSELGSVHERMLARSITLDAKLLAATITDDMVSVLHESRHPKSKAKLSFVFQTDSLSDESDRLLERAIKLGGLGVSMSAKQLRTEAGLDEPTDDAVGAAPELPSIDRILQGVE